MSSIFGPKRRSFTPYRNNQRQTSDSSWKFVNIENVRKKNSSKQFSWIKKLRETANLCVETMDSKRQVKGELGHAVQIRFCR